MVNLCTLPNQTHSQGRRHQLESVLAGCISCARRAPRSNLPLNPGGAGDPTLSPGSYCHPLMTRLPLGFLCSHPTPTEGHGSRAQGRGKAVSSFPFPSSPLRGILHSYSPSEEQAGCIPAGVEQAGPCIVLPPSCSIACLKTHSKSTCLELHGFGISPRRAGPAA